MNTLTLDIAKWRCGLNSDNALGKGPTKLLNECGYMCCLGQFARQLGHSPDEIFDASIPSEILYRKEEGTLIYDQRGMLTQFASSAIHINDAYHDESGKPLTPQNRIAKLKELCKEYGYNLEIENEHLLEEYDE